MLVVADTSPLIVLVNIGEVAVLPALFGRVVIPPEIETELAKPNRPATVRQFIAAPPAWLVVRAPTMTESIATLHAGECAAISLARELGADLLLIDEDRGRRAAIRRQIRIAGTVGVLEMAAQRGILDLGEAFERIKHTDFWISHKLLDERLKVHRAKFPRPPGGP